MQKIVDFDKKSGSMQRYLRVAGIPAVMNLKDKNLSLIVLLKFSHLWKRDKTL